jgi:RNA polymerase sigma-70 factor (ECF subfamily)
MTETDESLWAARLMAVGTDRDREAFAALFRHYAPRVKAFLIRTGLAPSVAEDCMQDVMVTLWRKAHLYDPTRASVATWIFTIARNRKIDIIRRTRRPEPEDLPWGPEPAPAQAEVLALAEASRRLTEAVAQLPPKQRDLIERAFFGDLTHTEIAAQTGLPLGTIKSRIRLAIDRLRHAMKVDVIEATGPPRSTFGGEDRGRL